MKNQLVTGILFIFGLYLIVSFSRDILNLRKKAEQVGKEQTKVEKLESENEELKKRLEYVKSPEFLEKEAREKLGLAKEGETVVILSEDVEKIIDGSQSQASESSQEPNWKRWYKLFF